MKFIGTVTTLFCLGLAGMLAAPSAHADEWNRKTVVTFSEPIAIPGVHLRGWGVLPAGTYVFKILDSQSDRHIVQIFNQDETTIYATILAIPNYRLDVTDKTVITFRERPAGEPEALRAWFYPGANWGEEFVYPKARAMELAKIAKTPVLFSTVEVTTEVAEPMKSADEPIVVQLQQVPVKAFQPTGEEVELAQVVAPKAAEREVAPATLPTTASSFPLIGLLGLLALGGAFLLRAVSSKMA